MKREQNVLPTVKRISKGYSPHRQEKINQISNLPMLNIT